MYNTEQVNRFIWRARLLETTKKRKISEPTVRKIMEEVGRADLGKQEAKAHEILEVLNASKTEEEFLQNQLNKKETFCSKQHSFRSPICSYVSYLTRGYKERNSLYRTHYTKRNESSKPLAIMQLYCIK